MRPDTQKQDVAPPELLRQESVNPRQGLAKRLMSIAKETGPLMNDGRTSKEICDELYDDETGLPK
jgi:hypothetical protein